MLLMIFIAGTVFISFVRGRAREPFWQAFGLEAGFLVAILHYGFFEGVFAASYVNFLMGWIAPVITACSAADLTGRWMARMSARRR